MAPAEGAPGEGGPWSAAHVEAGVEEGGDASATPSSDSEERLGVAAALARRLEDPDVHVRWDVCVSLGHMGPAAAAHAEVLSQRLGDDSSAVVSAACEALTRMNECGAAALAALLEGMRPAKVYKTAAQVLGSMGDLALPHLGPLGVRLDDAEAEVRSAAAAAIGHLGQASPPITTSLARHACDDVDQGTRTACVEALQAMGAEGAKALAALFEAPNSLTRQRAVEALGHFGKASSVHAAAMAGLLQDHFATVRDAAVACLERMGESGAEALATHFHAEDTLVRRKTALAMAHLGPQAASQVAALIRLLEADSDATVCRHTAYALGCIGAPAASSIPALAAKITSENVDEVMRRTCAEALEKMHVKGAEALVNLLDLEDDVGQDVRREAARSIERLGSTAAVPFAGQLIVRLQQDDDDQVRRHLVRAIKSAPDANAQASECLAKLVGKENDVETVLASISGLAALGEAGAGYAEVMGRRLQDRNPAVRAAAAKALGEFGLEAATPHVHQLSKLLLEKEPNVVRQASLGTMGGLGEAAAMFAHTIGKCLRSDSAAVRGSAAKALARLAPLVSRHANALCPVALEDEDPEVRHAALDALVEMGRGGVGMLVTRIEDRRPEIRERVVSNLGALWQAGDFRMPVARRLQDESADVRKAAVYALGESGEASAQFVQEFSRMLVDFSAKVRCAVLDIFPKLGQGVAKYSLQVAEQLSCPDAAVRSKAAQALGFMGANGNCDHVGEVVGLVAGMLSDDVVSVRLSTVHSLYRLGHRSAPYAQALAAVVGDDDEAVSAAAVETLATLQAEGAAALAGCLADERTHVRLVVLKALGAMALLTEVAAVHAPSVVKHLEDTEKSVQHAALECIDCMGPPGAAALATRLDESDALVRQDTVEALGQLGDKAAVHALPLAHRLVDRFVSVRDSAAESLRRIGVATGPHLVLGLKHHDAAVRFVAVKALGEVGPPAALFALDVARCLEDDTPQVQRAALESLIHIGPSGAAAVADMLDHDPLAETRQGAAAALAQMGEAAAQQTPALSRALRDKDLRVSHAAARALAATGNRGLQALAGDVADVNALVRCLAVEALGSAGRAASLHSSTVGRALEDTDHRVWRAAIGALIAMGESGVVEMANRLEDANVSTRLIVLEGLAQAGALALPHADRLAGRLQDKDEVVRRAAAVSLGKLGPNAADHAPVLAKTLYDGDALVRRSSAEALGHIGPPAAPHHKALADRFVLEKRDAWLWRSTADSLKSIMGNEASKTHAQNVVKRLKDDSASVRWSAVVALGRLGDAARPHLEALASALHDMAPMVRRAAAQSLGTAGFGGIDAPAVCAAVVQSLQDPDASVREAAAGALARSGEAIWPHTAALGEALADSDVQVRRAVVAAFQELNAVATSRYSMAVAKVSSNAVDDASQQRHLSLAAAVFKAALEAAARRGDAEASSGGEAPRPQPPSAPRTGPPAPRPVPGVVAKASPEPAATRPDARAVLTAVRSQAPGLAKCISDAHTLVAVSAADCLVQMGHEGAQALAGCLQAGSSAVRFAAVESLQQIVPEAVPFAFEISCRLGDVNRTVRQKAGELLLSMGEPGETQLVRLLNDTDPLLRQRAAEVLGGRRVGGAEGEDATRGTSVPHAHALAGALHDADEVVRRAAADALGSLGEAALAKYASDLMSGMQNSDIKMNQTIIGNVVKMGKAAAPYGVNLAHRLKDSNVAVRRGAAAGLGQLGEDAFAYAPDLAFSLRDADAEVRRSAAEALGRIGKMAGSFAADLAVCLQDPDTGVRYAAIEALGNMGASGEAFVDDLARCLQYEDRDVWLAAARVLGRMGVVAAPYATAIARCLENSAPQSTVPVPWVCC